MAHQNLKSGYTRLADRLNRFPQGAPPSELLLKIFKILFSQEEAALIARMPIKPFTAQRAARIWKMELTQARKVLDTLAGRALILDIEHKDEVIYCLPPPMAGFFEFSLMRIREDVDQKVLSELYYEYMNVEEDFIKSLFGQDGTQIGRTFVHEPVLSNDNALHVLDYERATHIIKSAPHIGIGTCYCRHKMSHIHRNCDAPKEICMTFNSSAASLVRHGFARGVDASECLALLDEAYDRNLVQFGENVRQEVNFICNCCGCCCEAMISARKFSSLQPIHTTNFIPEIDSGACNGCSKCAAACPVEGMTMVSANDPHKPKKKTARLNPIDCLGCGVCVKVCSQGALLLKFRAKRVITPVDSVQRVVAMAIERGKLQHLIFDNRALMSHRAMAAVLGAILKLPPLKRMMASRQAKSQYIAHLISRSIAEQPTYQKAPEDSYPAN